MLAVNEKIQALLKQLRGFSLTARLLIGALMVIMIMSLVLVAQFAARPRMVPLGVQLDEDARVKAVNYLDIQNIDWAEGDGGLTVPAENRYSVLARLTENDLITTDQIDFDSILADDSPFTDRRTKDARYRVAKMNVLARMLGGMSNIDWAQVVIDEPDRPGGIGSARIEPSASVTVRTAGEPLTQVAVDGIAGMIAGAHAALKMENVYIVDARTGRRWRARGEDDLAPTRHLETKQASEKYVRAKIYDMLSHINDLRVAVNVQVVTIETVKRSVGVDEPKHGVRREESRELASSNQDSPLEPGVRPNTGQDLSVSSSRVSSTTENENRTDMLPAFPTHETQEIDAGGQAHKINATVMVPRSYFVGIYRQQQADESVTPDDATLKPLVDQEIARIEQSVKPLVDTGVVQGALPGDVVVTMYADLAGAGGAVAAGNAMLVGSGGVVERLVSGDVVKSVGLGTLALISLFLMLMVVRNASRREELPTAEELVGVPPALTEADSDLVGEASEATTAMEGLELDESDVRRSQMLRQINDLAANSSDEAAVLLRKWIKQE